jgi:chemotaxis protein CheD
MSLSETMVRMGELAVSSEPGHVLVSLGLGSCIGLALIDRRMGIAGLAHIVLPQSQGHAANENPRKFADLAVPEMLSELEAAGARKVRLEAVLVGGASMFAVSAASLEVGQRNEEAVRALLKGLRIPVVATATGGKRGRTIRVDVATSAVTVREAGGKDEELLAGSRALEAVA